MANLSSLVDYVTYSGISSGLVVDQEALFNQILLLTVDGLTAHYR